MKRGSQEGGNYKGWGDFADDQDKEQEYEHHASSSSEGGKKAKEKGSRPKVKEKERQINRKRMNGTAGKAREKLEDFISKMIWTNLMIGGDVKTRETRHGK